MFAASTYEETDTIDDCKRIPLPNKSIVKDRLFYRCANSIFD